jgi:CO/xanthine dehydrogenase FAD-binding subunit
VIWYRPRTLDELAGYLGQGSVTTIIGGGTGLLSRAMPGQLNGDAISLSELGLDRIATDGLDGCTIGATCTMSTIASSSHLCGWRAVREAAAATANPGARGVITLGGVIAARSPNADLLPALLASEATIRVMRGATGMISDAGVLDFLTSARRADEVVLGVRLGPPRVSAYEREATRSGPNPAIATSAGVRDHCGTVHFWIGGVTVVPFHCDEPLFVPTDSFISDHRCDARTRRRALHAIVGRLRTRLTASLNPVLAGELP